MEVDDVKCVNVVRGRTNHGGPPQDWDILSDASYHPGKERQLQPGVRALLCMAGRDGIRRGAERELGPNRGSEGLWV